MARDGAGDRYVELGAPQYALELQRLDQRLRALWRLGCNALVGWRPVPGGIHVLSVPFEELFRRTDIHRRVFSGVRWMGPQTFGVIARSLSADPVFVATGLLSDDVMGSHPGGAVERLISRYAVTRTERRAVFLIDISGFSLISPERQAAQLTTLQFSLNSAAEALHRIGDRIDPVQSSTGDGFYVWNRNKGCDADVSLFRLFTLLLIGHAQLQRRVDREAAPAIRSCFGIGSHYSYRQPGLLGDAGTDYIVGEVTIQLARLIEKARRNQILFSEFDRLDEDRQTILDTTAFLARASECLNDLPAVESIPASIQSLKTYLTGPKVDGAYRIRRIGVSDKHGICHTAYNAKINVRFKDGAPLYLGLQDSDLQFDASVMSLDD